MTALDKIRAGLNPVKTAKQTTPANAASGFAIDRLTDQQRERMLSGLEQQRATDQKAETERHTAEQRQREADAAKQRKDDADYKRWLEG